MHKDACTEDYECDVETLCTEGGLCACFAGWGEVDGDCKERSWQSWLVGIFMVAQAIRVGLLLLNSSLGLVKLTKDSQQIAPSVKRTAYFVVLASSLMCCNYIFICLSAMRLISYWTFMKYKVYLISVTEVFWLLPPATVFTVWIDLANATAVRSRMKRQLRRSKFVINGGMVALLLAMVVCIEQDRPDLVHLLRLFGVGVILMMCLIGSNKLLKKLNEGDKGQRSEKVASTSESVKEAATKMGLRAWYSILGLMTGAAALTRVQGAGNMYILGLLVSTYSEVSLIKGTFTYIQIFLKSEFDVGGSVLHCLYYLIPSLLKRCKDTKPVQTALNNYAKWDHDRHKKIGRLVRLQDFSESRTGGSVSNDSANGDSVVVVASPDSAAEETKVHEEAAAAAAIVVAAARKAARTATSRHLVVPMSETDEEDLLEGGGGGGFPAAPASTHRGRSVSRSGTLGGTGGRGRSALSRTNTYGVHHRQQDSYSQLAAGTPASVLHADKRKNMSRAHTYGSGAAGQEGPSRFAQLQRHATEALAIGPRQSNRVVPIDAAGADLFSAPLLYEESEGDTSDTREDQKGQQLIVKEQEEEEEEEMEEA